MKIFDKIINVIKQWIKPLVIAIITMCGIYLIWLFFSFPGRMTLDRLTGTFVPPEKEHVITIYNDGIIIHSYVGHYSVQKVDDYYVIVDHEEKNKSVKMYGTDIVIEEKEKGA